MTPYYEDIASGITIYHGDCREIVPTLGSFDLVFTSPPYNMGASPGGNGRGLYKPGHSSKGWRFAAGYGGHRDAMPTDAYNEWQRDVLRLCWEALEPTGAIYYNHRPRIEFKQWKLPLDWDFGGLPVRGVVTWDRFTGIGIGKGHYAQTYEWIIILAKPEWNLRDLSASAVGDVWRLGIEQDKRGHPCPFPEMLPGRAIVTTGARRVLDPFMGIGSTLAAAKRNGAAAVGIEIEERYCEIAAKRLAQSVMFGSEVA